MIKRLFISCWLSFASIAYSAVDIELTQGVNAIRPLAITVEQSQENTKFSEQISTLMQHDLHLTGLFSIDKLPATSPTSDDSKTMIQWKAYEAVIITKVLLSTEQNLTVEIQLIDPINEDNPIMLHRMYKGNLKNWHSLAHGISDDIYQQLTGEVGDFQHKIAYVAVKRYSDQPDGYALMIMDIDGANPQTLLTSTDPIMSPTWSPDGKTLTYVSFEGKRANIFNTNLISGKRHLVAHFPGINGAPAWSPDGKKMALVLSNTGVAKIYEMDLATKQITPLTTGPAIDTEPYYTRDGKRLLFTSDRGGQPQIYALDRETKQIERLTFRGRYNASPQLTTDNQTLIMLHREAGLYSIAEQNLLTGRITKLSPEGYNDSPAVAPHGRMVVYNQLNQEGSTLVLLSRNGQVSEIIPTPMGEPQQPVWSPLTKLKG